MIDEDDDEDTESVPELTNPNEHNAAAAGQCSNDELEAYRKQLENEVSFAEAKHSPSKKADDSIRRYIESCTQYLGNISIGPEVEVPNEIILPKQHVETDSSTKEENVKTLDNIQNVEKTAISQPENNENDDLSISSNDLETDDVKELVDIDPNSRMYRLKMVEKMLNDARSQRSYSTTASTIAPSVITDRIKRNMDVKEKKEIRKRSVAKGEASAVQRGRKENKHIVQEYAGWDY